VRAGHQPLAFDRALTLLVRHEPRQKTLFCCLFFVEFDFYFRRFILEYPRGDGAFRNHARRIKNRTYANI
jgi:hypothetical protein